MKIGEINVRDPFILKHENKYYPYGTRSQTTCGLASGFDVYISDDMENWSEPIAVFENDGSFWADRCYWPPECYYHKGKFYIFITLASEKQPSGTAIMIADNPTGPFKPWSDGPINPHNWECLDGTFYIDKKDVPYIVFSRSLKQEPKAGMYYMRLSEDLKFAIGEPKFMFFAAGTPWAKPFPYAKDEFGLKEDGYFSDGPYFHHSKSSKLLLLWSSWGEGEYSMGIAHSDNNELDGVWTQEKEALYGDNGGHGMFFEENEELFMVFHYPNTKNHERVKMQKVEDIGDTIVLYQLAI